jgi:large subunit ribosomal protein L21e
MVRSNGKRANTRDLFRKGHRSGGRANLSTYLNTYKIGDMVDVKVDSGVQKGMPHKFYQGRTGTIFNVSRTAVGVQVTKQLRQGIIINKRFHVRLEHLKKSRCNEDYLKRVKDREIDARAATARGEKYKVVKRIPVQPTPAHVIDASSMELVEPQAYEFIV